MKGLPDSKIYELELQYWPYKDSWKKVLEYIKKNAPQDGTLLDLMCGPGYLLGQISLNRKDLKLKGLDIDQRYINYSKQNYPEIDFEKGDIFSWHSDKLYDVVACTGSLHHIPYEKQTLIVKRMASMVKREGWVLISDCYIDDYSSETERKTAAAKLGYEYLRETIQNGAPNEAIEPAIDILWNDVMMKEFKTSLKKRLPIFEEVFGEINTLKTWPKFDSEYGDYISICYPKK